MFLPVEVSENGLVASISFTVPSSGSLSPGLTWRVARRYAVCAWTAMATCVARLAMGAIFVFSRLAQFEWDLSVVLIMWRVMGTKGRRNRNDTRFKSHG